MLGLSKEEMIAVAIGTIVQVTLLPELTLGKAIIIIVSSTFVGLYVVRPLVDYYALHGTFVEAIYATTATISRSILHIIIKALPVALQIKALKAMGIDYEDFKRLKEDSKDDDRQPK